MQDRKERSKPKNSQTSSNFDQLERERERENGFPQMASNETETWTLTW